MKLSRLEFLMEVDKHKRKKASKFLQFKHIFLINLPEVLRKLLNIILNYSFTNLPPFK